MPLLLILVVFGVVILLNKRGISLGASLLIGGLTGMALTGSLSRLPHIFKLTFTDPTTLDLLVSINLIQVLGIMLQEEGVLHRLVNRLFSIIRNGRMVLFSIPILMALIPGPGVVLMSAPIVEEAARAGRLDGTDKSYINFWFRSAVQASSPLTFAFILATGIAGINKGQYFLFLLPFTLIMLATGYWQELRKVDIEYNKENSPERLIWLSLTRDLAFIWIVLALYLGFNLYFSISISVSILWVVFFEKIPLSKCKQYFSKGISFDLTLLIMGIMFFKFVVDTSGLMQSVMTWALDLGVPILVLMLLLPLLIGLVVGAYAGAVALTFTFFAGTLSTIPAYVIINIMTRIGCLFSPVHSSRVLTVNFFNGDDADLQKKIMLSTLPMICLLAVYLLL